MFLVVTQVIVLLATSGINDSPVLEPVNHAVVTLEDLKAVNDDLKETNADLIEAISSSFETDTISSSFETDNLVEQELESEANNNAEIKSIVAPVVVSPVLDEKVNGAVVPKTKVAYGRKEIDSEITPDLESSLLDVREDVVAVDEVVAKVESKTSTIERIFDYIKYDDEGHGLSENAEQWSCVHDSVKGLTWEVKSKEDGLRNTENLYSWFDPEESRSRGITDGGRCKGNADCDTHAYIKAMNQERFCGHNDWRLPTREEMMSLVSNNESDEEVMINTSYFPETLPSWYWTASSNESRPEFAWYILFNKGMPLNDLKENPKHIRLVRSN
jgi:hypothetical protein